MAGTPQLSSSGAEIKRVLEAERALTPFVVFRDESGGQVLMTLDAGRPLLTVGRHSSCDISLPWDEKVSRTHAVLERLGEAWTIADDGISRNGTFLNSSRLASRQRLVDRDVVRVGATLLTFRHP